MEMEGDNIQLIQDESANGNNGNFDAKTESVVTTETINSGNDTINELHIFDFTKGTELTDCVLVVEGRKLYVSKSVLSIASPVFHKMFNSEFKEKDANEFELPGKQVSDVVELMRCIYPNLLAQVNHKNALKVIPLVKEYQVFHLKPQCERALVESIDGNTGVEELFLLLKEAELYDMKQLSAKCIRLASEKSNDAIEKGTEQIQPPSKAFVNILRNINTRMDERVKELQTEVNKFRDENLEFQESISILNEELDLLKRYITTKEKKEGNLELDAKLHWKDCSVILIMDVAKKTTSIERKCQVWNIPLEVAAKLVKTVQYYTEYEMPEIVIRRASLIENIECSMVVNCVIFNKLGLDKDVVVQEKCSFSNSMTICLKKLNEVGSPGFINDAKLVIIVNIYMSEPVLFKSVDVSGKSLFSIH